MAQDIFVIALSIVPNFVLFVIFSFLIVVLLYQFGKFILEKAKKLQNWLLHLN